MKEKQTFEQKLARLESIVGDIETSKKPLEELIKLFKEGMELSRACKSELNRLEMEVQKVVEQDAEGNLIVEEMEL